MTKSAPKHLTAGELRRFGWTVAVTVAVVLGLIIPAVLQRPLPTWPWWVAAALAFPASVAPVVLAPVYHAWMRIGAFLGVLNTRVLLAAVFYVVILPIALLTRLAGRDMMAKRYDQHRQSYRVVSKPIEKQDMEKPF